MSRNQRMKLEKGSQRAEVVMDQLEKKLEDSVRKGKTVKGRSVGALCCFGLGEVLTVFSLRGMR